MRKDKILITGANGQVGSELLFELRESMGPDCVIGSDVRALSGEENTGPFEIIDVLNGKRVSEIIRKHKITQIYHLASLLSATSEQNPQAAWDINTRGLLNILEVAKEESCLKIFWPSSIAVFGPHTPKKNTPQHTIMDPVTVYGISKLAGERWCEYYFLKYGIDIRSLRYPGLISYKSLPGGGTTDYAVHVFYAAVKNKNYECYLSEGTRLPMMYMPDAIQATAMVMESSENNIKVRSSYNIAGVSFSPTEIVSEIQKYFPDFCCTYHPDHREQIAEGWPESIDDSEASHDWKWKHEYNLEKMTGDMIKNIKNKKLIGI